MALEVPRLKVFISWSGKHAENLGKAFQTYLPDAINTILPFMSGVNIDKGTRWGEVLISGLQDSSCAIVCLTPESLGSTWVAFETGAVSRAAGGPEGARARIWTYLFGLEKKDLQLTPFAEYQATSANEEETLQLLKSINQLSPDQVSQEALLRRFESSFWPNFSKALADVPKAYGATDATKAPPAPDILEEILRTLRAMQRETWRGGALSYSPSAAFVAVVGAELHERGINEWTFDSSGGNVDLRVAGRHFTFAPDIVASVEAGSYPVSRLVAGIAKQVLPGVTNMPTQRNPQSAGQSLPKIPDKPS